MVKLARALQSQKALSPMWVTEFGMVKSTKELQPKKAPSPMWVTVSGMVSIANVSHSSKASSTICVSLVGISTTSSSSELTMPPRLAIASLLEHITLFGLKITLTTVSSAIPASNTFASLARNWPSPTMISTLVVLRVSSSQRCPSLICCLSSLPVVSGVTSRTRIAPLGCRAAILVTMAQRPTDGCELELIA